MPLPPSIQRFLNAVWWRLFLMRWAESVTICIGAACVVFGGAMSHSSVPPQTLAAAIFGLAACCGSVWSISNRATLFEAAVEADRQLKLHDLLGTALFVAAQPDSTPWNQAMLAMAEDRCRRLKPSQMIVGKFEPRTFGAIWLVVAFVLTMSILVGRPGDLRAAGREDDPSKVLALQQFLPSQQVDQDGATPNSSTPEQSRGTNLKSIDDDSSRSFEQDRPDPNGGNSDGNTSAARSNSGTGPGTSVTPTFHADRLLPQAAMSLAKSVHTGDATGGNGNQSSNLCGHGDAQAGRVQSDRSGHSVDPAQMIGQTQAKSDGPGATHVPDWAADLVKDYFQGD